MNPDDLSQRLSRIATHWSMVLEAHGDAAEESRSARRHLIENYNRSVYRYLLGAVRDANAAEELAQEFALRLLRGDFHRVNPSRGRFRDYIKTVLSNLVKDHFRSRQRRPRALAETAAAEVPDSSAAVAPTIEDCLREDVLARTWDSLKRTQPRYHLVLLLRAEHSDLSSEEMAERLLATAGGNWSALQVRKTLERARARFADLLLDEVKATLQCTTLDDLGSALEELKVLRYCRAALERRAGSESGS